MSSIHAHSNCNWVVCKASITNCLLFLDFSTLSRTLLKFASFNKTIRNYIFCILCQSKNLTLHFLSSFYKGEISSICMLYFTVLFLQPLVFPILRMLTYTQVLFFFLSMCKFLVCSFVVSMHV